jgi:hypothetical protein
MGKGLYFRKKLKRELAEGLKVEKDKAFLAKLSYKDAGKKLSGVKNLGGGMAKMDRKAKGHTWSKYDYGTKWENWNRTTRSAYKAGLLTKKIKVGNDVGNVDLI